MTDTPARRRRKPSPVAVFVTSAALFLAALGFLAFQVAQGRDPSLGPDALVAAKPQRPVVTVRRIIKRRVITTVIPAETGTAGSSPGSYSTGSAPPAVTTAPAPAPAAPVVTASS